MGMGGADEAGLLGGPLDPLFLSILLLLGLALGIDGAGAEGI